MRTDLVSGLRLSGLVDLLLFNPPYVPSPADEVGGAGISAAWAGGPRGRVVIDRFLTILPGLLSPAGVAYMVAVADNDVPELLDRLGTMGLSAQVVLSRSADEERLAIIRARRSR